MIWSYFIPLILNLLHHAWCIYADYKADQSLTWGDLSAMFLLTMIPFINLIALLVYICHYIYYYVDMMADSNFMHKTLFKKKD